MAKRPGGAMLQSDTPTRSQLIPVLTKWLEIGKKSELAPMMVTMVTVLLLFMSMDWDLIVYPFKFVEDNKTVQRHDLYVVVPDDPVRLPDDVESVLHPAAGREG